MVIFTVQNNVDMGILAILSKEASWIIWPVWVNRAFRFSGISFPKECYERREFYIVQLVNFIKIHYA